MINSQFELKQSRMMTRFRITLAAILGCLKVIRKFHIARQHHGRKQLRDGSAPDVPTGRVPRIARLMALAIRCDQLIRDGVIANQSELADFGRITTARMTQIMTLLNLAPDIQEQILFLPRTEHGRDKIIENDVRPIASTLEWRKQRRMWAELCQATSSRPEGAIT